MKSETSALYNLLELMPSESTNLNNEQNERTPPPKKSGNTFNTPSIIDNIVSELVRKSQNEKNETNDQDDRSCLPTPSQPIPPTHSERRLSIGENVVVFHRRRWSNNKGDRDTHLHGVVVHLGPVDFSPNNDLVGVRLISKDVGKGWHDGVVKGKRYFTAPPRGGMFVLRKNITYPAMVEDEVEDEDEDSRTSTCSFPTLLPSVVQIDLNSSSTGNHGLFVGGNTSVSTLGSGSDVAAWLKVERTKKAHQGVTKKLEVIGRDEETSSSPEHQFDVEEATATITLEDKLSRLLSVDRLLEQNHHLKEEITTCLRKQTSMQLVIEELQRELSTVKEVARTTTERKKQDGGYGTETVTETDTENEMTTQYTRNVNRKPRSNRRHRFRALPLCQSSMWSSLSLLESLLFLPSFCLTSGCSSKNRGQMYAGDDQNDNCTKEEEKKETKKEEQEHEQNGVVVEETTRNIWDEMTQSLSVVDGIPKRKAVADATATTQEEHTTKSKDDIDDDEARRCENINGVQRLAPAALEPTSTNMKEHKQENEIHDHKDTCVYSEELRFNSFELARMKQQYQSSLAQNDRLISTLVRVLDDRFSTLDILVTDIDNNHVERYAQRRKASAPEQTSTARGGRTKQENEDHDHDDMRAYREYYKAVTSELAQIKRQHQILSVQNKRQNSTPKNLYSPDPTLTNRMERKQKKEDHDQDDFSAYREELWVFASEMTQIKRKYKILSAHKERLNSILDVILA